MDCEDATIWCTCPRCHGKRYGCLVDWYDDHGGIMQLLHSEAQIELPGGTGRDERVVYLGSMDEDGDLQTMVSVFPAEGFAEVAFRRHSWETWGVPTVLERAE